MSNLYKVLNANACPPFVPNASAWPLPSPGAPGPWMVDPRGRGLCVTPCPTRWRGNPESDLVFEVEAEGVEGDPELSHEIVASRIRLVRQLSEAEILAVSEVWNASFRRRNGEE